MKTDNAIKHDIQDKQVDEMSEMDDSESNVNESPESYGGTGSGM